MSVARSNGLTHPGRKRRRNEDAYVCEPPLFAVADGMGGAQAGQLASRLAASALSEAAGGRQGSGEERVVELIREANRRVHERASADEAASGMGTTVTLAIVENGTVAIGHVGDSRAYLVREGKLEQLTQDHSLVAELVRSGRLSPEEADTHPQRSVITRALGPDPDVDIDTFSVEARPGDLFLLCSDGLTTMVGDDEIVSLVNEHRNDLEAAASALVKAANRSGGEDNITVVFFEIAGVEEELEQTREQTVPVAADADEEDADTLDELAGVALTADTEPERGRDVTVIGRPAVVVAPPAKRRGRSRRAVLLVVLLLGLLALVAGGGLWLMSRSHFVGAEDDGRVAVYQGVPWDIVDGIRLYRAVYVSPMLAAQLRQDERRELFDHDLGSKDEAMARVRALERKVGATTATSAQPPPPPPEQPPPPAPPPPAGEGSGGPGR
jgi:protein phosphatase